MAYGTRPYGIWAYSYGPYSTWRQVELGGVVLEGVSVSVSMLSLPVTHLIAATVGGRSSLHPALYLDGLVKVGPLTGRSGIYPNLRLYWEDEPPTECGDEWTPGVPCEPVWTPAAACDVAWAAPASCTVTWGAETGEDVPWAPLPAPPYLCPELEAVDG
jgi:hypothetical protein